ncbi:MAG: hypothetical protein AAFO69_20910, partial [Bacteroidota bacterium]
MDIVFLTLLILFSFTHFGWYYQSKLVISISLQFVKSHLIAIIIIVELLFFTKTNTLFDKIKDSSYSRRMGVGDRTMVIQ